MCSPLPSFNQNFTSKCTAAPSLACTLGQPTQPHAQLLNFTDLSMWVKIFSGTKQTSIITIIIIHHHYNHHQLIGEFGLRENVYYGAIFLSMTFIVLFCFLIVNRFVSTGATMVVIVIITIVIKIKYFSEQAMAPTSTTPTKRSTTWVRQQTITDVVLTKWSSEHSLLLVM